MTSQLKNKKKFTVLPQSIQFKQDLHYHKFIVKNTSLRTQTYQVINPNHQHYNVQTERKFTLAPGMSQVCHVTHVKCEKCHKDEFNKLRITSFDKQSLLVTLQCPQVVVEQVRLIQTIKSINLGEFNFDVEKQISFPVKNLTSSNLKLSMSVQSKCPEAFTLEFQENQIILLKQRTINVKGKLNFVSGCEFKIKIVISIISEENLNQVTKIQKIMLIGNALVKNQTVKSLTGKVIDSLSLKVLNGTSLHGEFHLDNNFRKDCTFKLIPEISSTNPNQFSSKWQESEILFSEDTGDIKAFEMKKISYEIKTCPNLNDINFIEKFSKIDFNDEFNLARMKSSKYFKKNVDVNVKVVFIQKQAQKCQNTYSFKVRLNIVNPALKIRYKSQTNKQVFEIYNESQMKVPFEIQNNTLYKVSTNKGLFEEDKNTLEFEWKKGSRPQSAITTFSLAYGKCNLFIKLPQYDLQIYNFAERENLRPSTSTIKKNLGLQKSQSMMLKRPLSALCNEMVAKKLMLVRDEDFYPQIPKFLALDYLKNEELQKVIVSSSQKGNIISNTWNKQVSIYFPNKGHLILKPLKAYLLPYKLQLHSFYMNEQEFYLSHAFTEALTKSVLRYNNINEETYTLSTRELTFAFNPNKKQYEVENSIVIKNTSKQTFKAFLLTVQDQCFVSGEQDNKVVVHPNESVSFRIKLIPTNSSRKQSKITKKLEFLINGKKELITCYGELLPVDCDYSPKQLKFTECHYGEEQTTQTIMLTNVGFSKLSYQIFSPQYVSINHLQTSGTIAGKGHAMIIVRFKPTTFLQNYKDHIKILIRGSHAIFIPVFIDTKKPSITILENSIDFGEGIFGDLLQTQITLENKNKTPSELKFDLTETELKFEDNTQQRSMTLKSNETKKLALITKITEIGTIRKKISQPIATIPGFGSIQSPLSYGYIGKENILDISPSGLCHTIVIDEIQSSFKIKLRSLIGQKVHLRAQLIPQKKFDQTFILSIEPQGGFQMAPYAEKEISINSLISDLQKLKEIQRNYSLFIYRKGHPKAYTSFKFNVKLPTPKLIIEPKQLYFPISGLNVWNHTNFKIENKGYKQIHFKIKKPTNIAFDLDVIPKFSSNITSNLPNQNKLTKLNNEAEVRVSFRAKTPLNFQNILVIEDNFGNSHQVKIFGLATNCPLLLSQSTGSMPISTKSIPSAGSMLGMRSATTMSSTAGTEYENQDQQIQHAKYLNYWIGSFMPHMKKENSFHQYLSRPQTLLEFLEYFSITIPKVNGQRMKLADIIFELRKLDIPLDVVNVDLLEDNVLSEWIKFTYIFLSKKFIHPDTLKWLSKVSGQTVDNYEVAYNNYKKIITNTLNNLFSKVFNTKIIEYEKIVERFDPFMEFLFKIESRKHLILSLNILYHKLCTIESETVKSEQFNHKLLITHNPKYEKTVNWIISSGLPEFVSNSGGTNIHVNISECGYYFTLDKTHSESEVKMGVKESGCIAILNSTLFEKCHFVQYELLEIQPKIHNVVIECEDKFVQEWILDYEAPVDSQYKIEFIGDPQFKCRYSNLGITKTGKKIPITITYSPNNLNPHNGTLTIMNKHFKEIYLIRGKTLFSQNIEYERQIRMYQGKKHVEVVEIPWQNPGNLTDRNSKKETTDSKKGDKAQKQEKGQNDVPTLTLVEYNEKRKEFLSHNISIVKHNKKQFMVKVKLQYLFEEPIKSLPLCYQIMNEDQTQSKIIRVVVRVIPKPIHIEAEIKCKLEQSVTEKIPIQNLTEDRQTVTIEFSKGSIDKYKHQKINSLGQQESERTTEGNFVQSSARVQNQFRVNKKGKTYLEPGQLDHINLTYRPDSLFETTCEVKITYNESQSVVYYKFKGIPEFPSSLHETIKIQCLAEQRKTFTIPLKSLVRQSTTFEVETNIRQLSGKDKIVLGSGQTLEYTVQVFSHHPGKLQGQIIFKSPQVTLVYPVQIDIMQNPHLAKCYRINSRIRHATILQLQLHNKSKEDIQYQVLCNHEYLICPQKFFIQKESKKILQATYLPYTVGEFEAQVRLYHPDLKEIVYDLFMRAEEHQQIVCGPQLQLLQPYVFVLPIKNTTSRDCLIERPQLPLDLKFKTDDLRFPLPLNAGKTFRLELLYLQKTLCNSFDEAIVIKTDSIGDYKFRCQANLLQTKTMENINVHYQNGKVGGKLDIPFKANFQNGFNQILNLNVEYRGTYNKIINSLKIKSSAQLTLQALQKTQIEGQITVNLPNKGQKSMMNIGSSQDLQTPIDLVLWTMKNKTRFEFVYPIKLIKIYENPHGISVRANAYELQKTLVNLAVVRDVSNWSIENLSDDFVKSSFVFTAVHSCENYLETVINKPFKYDGFIIFYNLKNQAERMPLRIDIGEPKYDMVVISSNVGEKAVVQIQLKNGKGPFKVQLTNNKTEQFGVEPTVGEFVQQNGESVAKINFFYLPNDYSGMKRAKVAITSQQGCFYFNLMGKFKTYKKPTEKKIYE